MEYYEKTVYARASCGKQWSTPGEAELCYKKGRIMRLAEEADKHKTFAFDDAIEQLEEALEEG